MDEELLRAYVLAEDRGAVVREQVKGTQAYFLLNILHDLNTDRPHDAEVLLHQWEKSTRKLPKDYTLLRNRCMAALYDKKPELALKHFERQFKIKLQHPAPPSATTAHSDLGASVTTALDPRKVDLDELTKELLPRDPGLNTFSDDAVPWLSDHWRRLTADQLAALVQRIPLPTHKDIVAILAADCKNGFKKGDVRLAPVVFQLPIPQLDQLATSCPALLQNREFVGGYLQKLGASPTTRLHTDLAKLEQYLNAAVAFTANLSPAFNDFRAAALYHKLNYLISHFELYDVDLFVEYLSIPKRAPLAKPLSKKTKDTAFHVARTRLSLPGSGLPAVTDDSPFIRDFLEYIFKTDSITSTEPFAQHLDEAAVKHIFAKAKLSSGATDTERYVNMLKGVVDVAAYQKEKRLQFTKQNKKHYAVGEPVMLSVELKNIQRLDIQVFEVNTFNYYKDKQQQVPSTLNVDGLLPSLKATRSYDKFPSIAIHRHELELKELDHRGVFLVELRGAGLSSRAVVCIGRLYATTAPGVAGTEVRVYNELGQHLPKATAWMEGREYEPSDPVDDFVTLPFSSSDRNASVILHADGFFSLATVPLLRESYTLTSRCLVNTEAFVRGNLQARVVVLPSLLLASPSLRVSPTLLSQPTVTTVLLDRQREVLTQTDHSIALSDGTDPELVVKVPPAAATLHVTVRGTVKLLDGTKQTVAHTTQHDIHAAASMGGKHSSSSSIPPTELHASIESMYLVCGEESSSHAGGSGGSKKTAKDKSPGGSGDAWDAGASYALHVRGRCGEVRKGVRVGVTLQHEYIHQRITAELQTDSEGVAHLGALPLITSVEAFLGTGKSNTWELDACHHFAPLPSSLTLMEGQPYTLPYTGPQRAVHVFSTEERDAAVTRSASGSTVLENHTASALQFSASSFTFTAPEPGTYRLVIEWQTEVREQEAIAITALARNPVEACRGRVAPPEGTEHPGTYTASLHTVGGTPTPALVYVRGVAVDAAAGEVQVDLGNARPESTRVHVFSRWSCVSPEWVEHMLDGDSGGPTPFEGQLHAPTTAAPPSCRYLSGRVLSDEHRYVLRRRGLPPRLGNMLDKPQLVLNPTELRETATRHEALERERAWDTGGNQARSMQARAARRQLKTAAGYQGPPRVGGIGNGFAAVPAYDWFETPACLAANARPSSDDPSKVAISLPPKALAGAARVFVVVVDEEQLLFDSSPVTHAQQRAPNARDVRHRWPHSLDKPYAEERQVVPLQPGTAWSPTLRSHGSATATVAAAGGGGGGGGGGDQRLEEGLQGETSAEAAVFDTVDTVEKLLSGLVSLLPSDQAAQLAKFSFLTRWPRLSTEAKVEYYQEHCCHELNLLLFNKDPMFFQDVVRPFLASKLDKDIVDCCLLYSDLTSHLPALRSRMGDSCPVVEKLLLAWRGVLSPSELAAFLQATTKEQRNSPRVAALFDRLITARQQQQQAEAEEEEEEEEEQEEMSVEADEEEGEGMMAPQAMALMEADFLQAAPGGQARQRAAPALGGGGMLMRGGQQKRRRRAAPKLAKPVGKTKEYAEKTYWEHNPERRLLLRASPFWADCASALADQTSAGGTAPHRPACVAPTWLHAAGTTVNEALLVLALLDLPFDNTMHVDDAQRITHTNKCFVLTSALRPLTEKDEGKTMVFQTFFDPLGAADSPAPTEFQTGRVYGTRIICTNMTNSSLQVDLLRQVPDGAIPLPTVSSKNSEHVQLSSFGIHRTELFFYFPYAGEFQGYPACLSKDSKLMCMATPSTAKAVDDLTTYDTTSWSSVAAHGTNDEVLAFLHEHPESRAEAHRVLWRCRSKEFFLQLVDVLRQTGTFDEQVWGYAVKHRDDKSLGELLASKQKHFGPGLKTSFLVTPWNLNYKHTDFWPVVNARAHSITEEKTQVLNDAVLDKKRLLFRDLIFNSTLPPEALPILCYFMILEDNIDGAKQMLQRARAQQGGEVCSLQLDYLQCYLDFYEGPELSAAREIVAKRAKMSLPGWNTKFSEIAAMISEIDSGTPATSDAKSTSAVPAMDISLQGHDVAISYSGIGEAGAEATVNFYVMDIELLFSSQPFAQSGKPTFTYVLPNLANKVPLSSSEGRVVHTLPDVAQKRDGLVEVVCRGISRTANYFATRLRAQILETHGHIRVMDMEGRPLPASYVKVYARKKDDTVSFFKDGYTDLRGKFDYFSVNTEEKDVQELSILVSHKEHGALIQTAKPPSH